MFIFVGKWCLKLHFNVYFCGRAMPAKRQCLFLWESGAKRQRLFLWESGVSYTLMFISVGE